VIEWERYATLPSESKMRENGQPQCPWCPYTADRLKPMLLPMESAHHKQWLELALYPPIAAGVY
jgi:hypothetical protein